MSEARPRVVCLATARTPWLARLSQWVNSGSLAVDLLRCLTPAEFESALRSQPVALGLVDAASRHADRDLLAMITAAGGAAAVVTGGGGPERDWAALGAHAVLDPAFELSDVIDLLRSGERATDPRTGLRDAAPPGHGTGHLIGVCGPGGTGASTVAIGLAQGLAQQVERVLLADLVPGGQQALLHGGSALPGGLAVLTEAHRRRGASTADVEAVAHPVPGRGYRLLTGLFHRRAWPSLRPLALGAALATLVELFDAVVCDFEPDLEGESEAGSLDVEERNAASRLVATRASALLVVGMPGVKGFHSLATVIEDLLAFGVEPARIIPTVNRAPRNPLARAELAAAVAELSEHGRVAPVVFLPDRLPERLVVDADRLPSWFVDPCVGATTAVVSGLPRPGAEPVPVPVMVRSGVPV